MNRTALCAPQCSTPLTSVNISVTAVGIEKEGNWALVSFDGKEAIVAQQGETLRKCYKVSQVTHNSVVLTDISNTFSREFFLAGYAGSPTETSPPRAPGKKSATANTAVVKPLSPHVSAIEYPLSFESDSYPRAILTAKQDDEIFNDYDVIGLDSTIPDSAPGSPASHKESGVLIGKNSRDSFFGAIGLQETHRIISINGKRVSSKQDISQALKGVGRGELNITYYDPAEGGLLTTHGAIRRSKKQ